MKRVRPSPTRQLVVDQVAVWIFPASKNSGVRREGIPESPLHYLDGPVDLSHKSLAGADLVRIETLVSGEANLGPASKHGTHIASVIFGDHEGPIKGIAPQCRGLVLPIFKDGDADSIALCSQIDLARVINQAAQAGAHVINISGGEISTASIAALTMVAAPCMRTWWAS